MELVALTSVGMLHLPKSPHKGDVAYSRLYVATESRPAVISKIPRASLQAYIDAIRPHVAESAPYVPALPQAVAKVDARLASRLGKRATPELWQQRSESVASAREMWRDLYDGEPTDRDLESALKLTPGAIRRWRNVHPELFPRQ